MSIVEKIKPDLTSYSNTMVETFMNCRKRFQYAFVDQLQAKRDPKERVEGGVSRGQAGHSFLEKFFKEIQAGHDTQGAMELAIREHVRHMSDNVAMERALSWIRDVWPTLDWEILEVEVKFKIPIGDGLFFTGTIDLVVRDRTDNKIYIVDHKFLKDLYPREITALMAQMPKYAAALQILGYKVDGAIYNMLRNRIVKNIHTVETARMDYLEVNDHRIKEALATQVMVSKEIAEGFYPHRNASKINCGFCPFKTLCEMEVQGQKTAITREIAFEQNDYVYEGNEITA